MLICDFCMRTLHRLDTESLDSVHRFRYHTERTGVVRITLCRDCETDAVAEVEATLKRLRSRSLTEAVPSLTEDQLEAVGKFYAYRTKDGLADSRSTTVHRVK